ncbi:MAG: NADH-quinone oxidoreductase subunit J [Chromatiales bacterium]|nr:NADH-quinone oxidoreductase subunit J [Chromatiales bacterium]
MNASVLMIALPLLAAFLLPLTGPLARWVGPFAAALNIALGISLWQTVAQEGPSVVVMGGFAAPLGIVFRVDTLAVLFATALAALVLILWPRTSADPRRESALLLILLAAGCGLAFSGDLFNLFVFYELIAVASYGLVAASRERLAAAAGLRYLVLSALGSAFALLGIGLVYALAGTLNLADLSRHADALNSPLGLAAFALMLLGFGVKAELFPVNAWVAEVYSTATARTTALLAGGVSKLALLIVLHLVLLVYAQPAALSLLLTLGLLSIVSGQFAGYRAADLPRMLAYSSIAQLGMIAAAFSVSGEAGVLAGLALALHHLIVKPALFLVGDGWPKCVDSLAGLGRAEPWRAALFVLLALSLLGIPPLPGFWAKLLLLKALLGMGEPAWNLAAAVVLLGTAIEGAYLLRVLQTLFRGTTNAKPATFGGALPAGVLGVALLLVMLAATPVGGALQRAAQQAADVPAYVADTLGGSPQ